jgi:hypothetical protein
MQCSFADRVAGPAHPAEPIFEVEEQKEVRAQVAQGIAWPPPRAEAEDFGVGRSLRSNAGDSLATRLAGQDNGGKFTLKFSLV